jgi:hypothetical protein
VRSLVLVGCGDGLQLQLEMAAFDDGAVGHGNWQIRMNQPLVLKQCHCPEADIQYRA